MKILTAFYSRTGTTRKAADQIASFLKGKGAEIVTEEIIDTKNRKGFFGWLRAGRDAMKKRETEVRPVQADVASFDLVVVGGPVWGWTVCPAVRTFLSGQKDQIRKAAFFCTMGGSGAERTFGEMEEILGKAPEATLALTEKQVKAEDEAGYLEKVRNFADLLAPSS